MADARLHSWLPALRFGRAMLEALRDESTYDIRKNPSLWVGFLLAIPIPLLTWMAGSADWLKFLTLLAPPFWAVLIGAAGRVGMNAKQERDILAGEIQRVVYQARETEAHLGEEQMRRRALEREKREVVTELKLAREIQATLLPEAIQRPDAEVVCRMVPTRFIGGDYVHANVVEGRWLYLCLFDVSGHGISAALVVARMHGMVRRLTLTKRSPVEMLARINHSAQRLLQHTYFFMTAAIARVDLRSGATEFVTAGHPAQILLRADGSLETLQTRNKLLGMHDDPLDPDRPDLRVDLSAGDTLVFFTDGLYEVLEGGKGEVLGEEALHERIRAAGALEPQLLIGEVLSDLTDFQGRSDFDDDVTMLAARYLGPSPQS